MSAESGPGPTLLCASGPILTRRDPVDVEVERAVGLRRDAGPAAREDPVDLSLHRLIQINEQQRDRLGSQSVELAFLAGFGIGISSGADADRLLDEVLARCAEVTGFRCGAAYLIAAGQPRLQSQIGFPESRPLADFFGDPDLLSEAVAAAQGGIAHLPSERLDAGRSALVLRRAELCSLLVAPVCDPG